MVGFGFVCLFDWIVGVVFVFGMFVCVLFGWCVGIVMMMLLMLYWCGQLFGVCVVVEFFVQYVVCYYGSGLDDVCV